MEKKIKCIKIEFENAFKENCRNQSSLKILKINLKGAELFQSRRKKGSNRFNKFESKLCEMFLTLVKVYSAPFIAWQIVS